MDAKGERIRQHGLFSGCSNEQIAWIARTADEVALNGGEVIVSKGASAREFIVVIDGVAVSQTGIVYGPGTYFGEMDVLDGSAHTATIEALSSMRILVFDSRSFAGLLARASTVSRKLMRGLVTAARSAA